MQDSPIQIGPISLQDFEIPASVRFGGRHRLAIHILSTGHRVVERLGPEDDEIVFQGTFSGPNAEARVQLFDNLRLSGETVWLTWESFRRRVVVKSFVADYHSPWWIPYSVTCAVVIQTLPDVSGPASVREAVMADIGNALTATPGAALPLGSLKTVVSAPDSLIAGSTGRTQASGIVSEILASINQLIATQSVSLLTDVGITHNINDLGSTFADKVSCAGALAGSAAARCYIGRIRANLNRVGH